MNSIIINIFLILSLLLGKASLPDEISKAIKNGDADKLSIYFDNSLNLSIPDNEGVYSKTQAKLILKTFFLKNKPSDFKVAHNGDSKNNSHYSIGNLKTTNGLFRVYILYKNGKNQKATIIELRIESDE